MPYIKGNVTKALDTDPKNISIALVEEIPSQVLVNTV